MSVEDCAHCGHHISFHEHFGKRIPGACWYQNPNSFVIAKDAMEYALALGLGNDESNDLVKHVCRNRCCRCCHWVSRSVA